jgi:VIT1/CCC1 family predicted Fe2+/Mn2+ transporter
MNPTKVSPSANGKKRPQLADSISRLDSILEGLSDAIPATVAESIQQALATAVKDAVQVALNEALNNADVIAALAARLPVQVPVAESVVIERPAQVEQAQPTKPSAMKAWLGWLRAGWNNAVQWTGGRISAGMLWCRGLLAKLRAGCEAAWQVRGTVGVGLAAGVLIGVVAYYFGPLFASVLCGLAATAMTTLGILAAPFVRLLGLVGGGQK